MPTLVIENMPSKLYADLQKAATSNRRSITQQTLTFLEQCLTRSFALNKTVSPNRPSEPTNKPISQDEQNPFRRLRGVATVKMSTDEIMSLTRGEE
jgi:hypothetical protein